MESTEKKTLKSVRLSCRYSNGMVMTFMGRLVSHEDETLRVVTSEKFDVGIPLTATCDLLSGPTVFRVAKVTRWEDQAGYFLLELQPPTQPTPTRPKPATLQALAGPPATSTVAKPARPELRAKTAVPEAFRAAAAVLADRLVLVGPRATLQDALDGMRPRSAKACVWVAATALLLLAQRNGLAESLPLVRSLGSAR